MNKGFIDIGEPELASELGMMENQQLRIRFADAVDAETLAEIGRKSFYDAFAKDNTPEDMAAYLAEAFSVEQVTKEIADAKNLFLIVEIDGQPAGYAKLRVNEAPPAVTGKKPIEIERFYILQNWHGRGSAQSLMQRCLEEAKQHGHQTIFLGVWEHNQRAIAFYHKCGFVKVGEHPFLLGSDLQTDWLMQYEIES